MKSDEPLGKFPPFFLVYDYRPQDWGQSARAQGLIAQLIRNKFPHSVDQWSPPLPSREEGYFLRSIGPYLGAHFVRPEALQQAGFAPLRRTLYIRRARDSLMDASQRVGSIRPLHPPRIH